MVVVVLLGLSGIISGYEVAFFSLPTSDVESIALRKHLGDRHVLFFRRRPQRLLATLLLANNLVNLGLILLLATVLGSLHSLLQWPTAVWVILDTVLITGLLLVFGEITPKVYAANQQLRFLRLFSVLMRGIYYAFAPFSWVLARSTRFLYRKPLGLAEMSQDELKGAIDLTDIREADADEKQLLKALVNLNHMPVRAVMRPRVNVIAFDETQPAEQLFAVINQHPYSRFPVFRETLDTVIGVLHIKDLLPALEADVNYAWQDAVREPLFVPESMRIGPLLQRFKDERLHIAIVVDEYGGTAGIVTLQDILDEIFGELTEPESHTERRAVRRLSDDSYLLDGSLPLQEAARMLQLPDDYFDGIREENDTLGGLLIELNGNFPSQGQVIVAQDLHFEVAAQTGKRIQLVKVSRPAHPPTEEV